MDEIGTKILYSQGREKLMARKCSAFIEIFQYRPTGILCDNIHLGYVDNWGGVRRLSGFYVIQSN